MNPDPRNIDPTFTVEIQHADGRREFVHGATDVLEIPGYLRVAVRHPAANGIPAFTAEHWYTGGRFIARHD